jgi:3-deoxy-D-manno-octulosonate 8-phosphate phosphatase (KDO 8-P phosphatase)
LGTRTEAAQIRCLCLDVDGVLTDGRLYVDDQGRGARLFHVHDGFAIRWFMNLGGEVVICTGKTSPAVDARARELDIRHVIQGSRHKVEDLSRLLDGLGIQLSEVAMVGDDLPDLPVLKRCGFPIAAANAVDEVKAVARFVTASHGGQGAVREAIEHLMRASGRWSDVLRHYEADDDAQDAPGGRADD